MLCSMVFPALLNADQQRPDHRQTKQANCTQDHESDAVPMHLSLHVSACFSTQQTRQSESLQTASGERCLRTVRNGSKCRLTDWDWSGLLKQHSGGVPFHPAYQPQPLDTDLRSIRRLPAQPAVPFHSTLAHAL